MCQGDHINTKTHETYNEIALKILNEFYMELGIHLKVMLRHTA